MVIANELEVRTDHLPCEAAGLPHTMCGPFDPYSQDLDGQVILRNLHPSCFGTPSCKQATHVRMSAKKKVFDYHKMKSDVI